MTNSYDYKDILWVDDYLEGDDSDLEKNIPIYFPEEYHLRIHTEKYILSVLQYLEENFSNISCAIMDIDLSQGFIDGGLEEQNAINKILEKYQVDAAASEDGTTLKPGFGRNAGYYIYLYLVHRGMPADRIVMLSGNVGPQNISDDWDHHFKASGIRSPLALDKQDCKLDPRKKKPSKRVKNWINWLKDSFTPAYQFRDCIIAMTACLQAMLEKTDSLNEKKDAEETIKLRDFWFEKMSHSAKIDPIPIIKNLHRQALNISLQSLKGSEEQVANVLFPIVWQVVGPWEAATYENYLLKPEFSYTTIGKIARNWLAHYCLKKLDLQTAIFLFGICMRGMFVFHNAPIKIMKRYEWWEKHLLELLHQLDKKWEDELRGFSWDPNMFIENEYFDILYKSGTTEQNAISKILYNLDKQWENTLYKENKNDVEDELWFPYKIIILSAYEFYERTKKVHDYGFSTNIGRLISYIGDKNNPYFKYYEEDLLRAFMHGVFGLYAKAEDLSDISSDKFSLEFSLYRPRFGVKEGYKADVWRVRYLQAVLCRIIYALVKND